MRIKVIGKVISPKRKKRTKNLIQNDYVSDSYCASCEIGEVITTYETDWLFATFQEAFKEACYVLSEVLKLDSEEIFDFSVICTCDDNGTEMYELRIVTSPEVIEKLPKDLTYENNGNLSQKTSEQSSDNSFENRSLNKRQIEREAARQKKADRNAQIRLLAENGYTREEISKKANCSVKTVTAVLNTGKPTKAERDANILKLYTEGMSILKIAETLSISRNTVKSVLSKNAASGYGSKTS